MKKLDKKEYALIGIFAVILILIILIVVSNHKNDGYKSKIDQNKSKYSVVSNASTFFTVQECVSKYVNKLSKKDTDSIQILLNSKYIEDQGITTDNVLEKVDDLNGSYSFKAKKMYVEEIKKDQLRYYVYGTITENRFEQDGEAKEYYLIVNIYEDNYTFDVIPDDGRTFRGIK